MRSKKSIPFKSKKTVAVLVDGETEFWYLQMIKRNEKNIKVDIKPEIPQKKKLEDQFAKVCEYASYYDTVFWIVDLDVILSETNKCKKGQQTPIDIFLKFRDSAQKNFKNVTMIINQPCLEYWLLIHFKCTAQQFPNCEKAHSLLKTYLKDYSKSEKYFTKQDSDIYLKLKSNLSTAIGNSRNLKAFDHKNCHDGFTEMHKLFDALEIK